MAKIFRRKQRGKVSDCWHMSYTDEHGQRQRRSTGTSCEETARDILSATMARVAKLRNGLADPAVEKLLSAKAHAIQSLVDLWQRSQIAKGVSEDWRKHQIYWINEFIKVRSVRTLADLTRDNVEGYVDNLIAGDDLGAKAIQSRLRTVRQFSKWLIDRDMLTENPTAKVRSPNPDTNRKYRRRYLLREEWPWLCEYLASDPKRFRKTDGHDRRLIYQTAIETGYRAGELKQINRAGVITTARKPHILATRDQTKNGKPAKQYITPELCRMLKDGVGNKLSGALVFPMPRSREDASEMLRRDLAGSRTLWLRSFRDPSERIESESSDFLLPTNSEGKVLDFHALRHTCGAWLCLAGLASGHLDLRRVQRVMRHHSITLTLETYGHMLPDSDAEAIADLGRWMAG